MKIIKENIENFKKAEPMETVIDPATADAIKGDQESQKETKDLIDPMVRKNVKAFLGADKQPTPDKIKESKLNLDESLFEDYIKEDLIYGDSSIKEYVDVIEKYYQGDLHVFLNDLFIEDQFAIDDPQMLYELAVRIGEMVEDYVDESLKESKVIKESLDDLVSDTLSYIYDTVTSVGDEEEFLDICTRQFNMTPAEIHKYCDDFVRDYSSLNETFNRLNYDKQKFGGFKLKEPWEKTRDKFVGKEVIFTAKSGLSKDWGLNDDDIELMSKYVGKKAVITGLDTGAMDSEDFEDYYWTIKFDDGQELEGVSGVELDIEDEVKEGVKKDTPFLNEEIDKTTTARLDDVYDDLINSGHTVEEIADILKEYADAIIEDDKFIRQQQEEETDESLLEYRTKEDDEENQLFNRIYRELDIDGYAIKKGHPVAKFNSDQIGVDYKDNGDCILKIKNDNEKIIKDALNYSVKNFGVETEIEKTSEGFTGKIIIPEAICDETPSQTKERMNKK